MSDEENTVIFISSAVQKEDLLKKATEELAEEVRKSCDLFIYLFFFFPKRMRHFGLLLAYGVTDSS